MLNLNTYKAHLVNYYIRANENNPTAKNERVKHIKKNYSDGFLNRIIKNTDRFITMLITKMAKERYISEGNIFDTLELPVTKNPIEYILNGCGGGWPADTLFYWNGKNKKALVSKYLTEQFFSDNFHIEIQDGKFSINGPIEIFDTTIDFLKK